MWWCLSCQLDADPVYASPSWGAAEQDELHYAHVSFVQNQADPVYANIRVCYRREAVRDEEETEYAAVRFNRSRSQSK